MPLVESLIHSIREMKYALSCRARRVGMLAIPAPLLQYQHSVANFASFLFVCHTVACRSVDLPSTNQLLFPYLSLDTYVIMYMGGPCELLSITCKLVTH